MALQYYLGLPGALLAIRGPSPADYSSVVNRLGGVHELLTGRLVRDTIGHRRQIGFKTVGLTLQQYSQLEQMYVLPNGPYRFIDPTETNLLTYNQSSGTDYSRDTSDLIARFQGVITSDTTQLRSGVRSIKWDTQTALGAANRGVYCYSNNTTPDRSWCPVLPSTQYTASAFMRASAAVNMYMTVDWMTSTGSFISNSAGSAAAPSTVNFNSQFTVTANSPSNAAYAAPAALNSATTGAAVQVWIDEWQFEQAGAASTWVLGSGVPLVTIDSLIPGYATYPLLAVEMVLLEV